VFIELRQATGPEVGWQMSASVAGALLAASIVIYIIIRILTHRHEDDGPPRNGKARARKGSAPKPPGPAP
jgi:hypothetical protein